MADLVEALHNLSRQRGRGDASPLIDLRRFPAREGGRISHLPISQRLEQAWLTLTGQPFRQHQSLALSALRRGEPFALVGGGPAARQTLHLLALELLRAEPGACAILLAPDEDSASMHLGELERMSQALSQPVAVGAASGERSRLALAARAIVATPESLHDRLLRRHDRAWSALWPRLRLLLIADAQRYDGVAGSHLSALMLRASRLAPENPPLQFGAGLVDVSGADAALAQISGLAWRMIPADDTPRPEVTVALWRAGGDRARELTALALGLQRAGATVHVTTTPLEVAPLRALIGADVAAVSVAASVLPAHVQILAGAGLGGASLRAAIDSGASLVVLLLGEEPAERSLARLASRGEGPLPLVEGPPPAWPVAPLNAYVAAQHLLCAASERPVSGAELERWGYGSIAARLEQRGELARLPDPEPLWQPRAGGDDPYTGLGLRAAGVAPVLVADDQGAPLGTIDPAAFDRWAFRGAALPPLRGGLRVLGRDEDQLALTLRAGGEARRTLPLRRCSARVRDTRERRELRGVSLGWGRLIVEEEIYGYREHTPGNAPAERALSPALSTSWSAPALWLDLPAAPFAPAGQLVGWSLVAALPLLALGEPGDLVPAYDAEAQRLFFIDANPGGNGLSDWLYSHLEELLPLAYDVALDCGGDPLLEPVARADKDWLLGLLSGRAGSKGARAQEELEALREPPRKIAPIRPEPPRAEPVRPEPPLREPVRPEPVRPEPPLREPPARKIEPVRPEPPRAEPVRSEPPLREPPPREPVRSEPPPRKAEPVRSEPVRSEPPLREPPPRKAEPSREDRRSGTSPRRTVGRAVPEQPELLPPEDEAPPAPARSGRDASPRQKRRRDREQPRSAERRSGRESRTRQAEPEDPPPSRVARQSPPEPEPEPKRRPGREPAPEPERRSSRESRVRQAEPEAPPPSRAARQSPPPPEPEPEPEPLLPDAAAMVARLRRLREQRERRAPQAPAPRPVTHDSEGESRFRPGDRIHCTPYGEGEVLASRLDDDREMLLVRFPEHGELTVDAAVSAARLVAAAPEPEPDF